MENSTIILYTGDGRGKTSAAIGAIVRTIGSGRSAALIQFMKGKLLSNERKFFENHPNSIYIYTAGDGFFRDEDEREYQTALAKAGIEESKKAIESGKYSLVVLDEINTATSLGIVKEEVVLELIRNRKDTNIILTGRNAPQAFIEISDTVSKIESVKHAFDSGRSATEGIDY